MNEQIIIIIFGNGGIIAFMCFLNVLFSSKLNFSKDFHFFFVQCSEGPADSICSSKFDQSDIFITLRVQIITVVEKNERFLLSSVLTKNTHHAVFIGSNHLCTAHNF